MDDERTMAYMIFMNIGMFHFGKQHCFKMFALVFGASHNLYYSLYVFIKKYYKKNAIISKATCA